MISNILTVWGQPAPYVMQGVTTHTVRKGRRQVWGHAPLVLAPEDGDRRRSRPVWATKCNLVSDPNDKTAEKEQSRLMCQDTVVLTCRAG